MPWKLIIIINIIIKAIEWKKKIAIYSNVLGINIRYIAFHRV